MDPTNNKLLTYLEGFQIEPGKEPDLKKYDTDYDRQFLTRQEGEDLLAADIVKMADLQGKLYAHGQYSLLIIIQGMDAAGKDGVIKHVMSGLNPQGVKVTSFKAPTAAELGHDYLWRHYIALPSRGQVGIFNRSHYENVLVTKVHPELILKEQLPGILGVKDIDKEFWDKRYKQINHFEKTLFENGTIILKFFLHLSKKEQGKRFLGRIDQADKNWKFSIDDIRERAFWKDYRKAFEDMLGQTSMDHSPWFVIPSDDKWFTRLAIANIIYRSLDKLDLSYPTASKEQKQFLLKAKEELLEEKMKSDTLKDSESGLPN
jgi:PPK2 family polyphosphate:nucleotide phosphotransferase